MHVDIRLTTPDEWRERRDLRLEMLEDTPLAFGDRLESARRYSEADWQSRAARAVAPGNCQAAAVTPDGRWVGTMGAFVGRDGRAVLVTVYVTPVFRGRAAGVADRLLEFVEQWVRDSTDATELILEVHEQNETAMRFYRRHGFVPTGHTQPYPLAPAQREIEFGKSLY